MLKPIMLVFALAALALPAAAQEQDWPPSSALARLQTSMSITRASFQRQADQASGVAEPDALLLHAWFHRQVNSVEQLRAECARRLPGASIRQALTINMGLRQELVVVCSAREDDATVDESQLAELPSKAAALAERCRARGGTPVGDALSLHNGRFVHRVQICRRNDSR